MRLASTALLMIGSLGLLISAGLGVFAFLLFITQTGSQMAYRTIGIFAWSSMGITALGAILERRRRERHG